MARPKTKSELIQASKEEFAKLWDLIQSMTDEEQNANFLFEDRDKNIRDVLVHLYEWHQMLKGWHQIGTIEGGMPAVPGEGYTWRTLPALNAEIWKKYQNVSLLAAKKMLQDSHAMMLRLIETHSNEELFTPSLYQWTKSTSLGSYFVSSTSSHYQWAIKKIKKHIKSYGSTFLNKK